MTDTRDQIRIKADEALLEAETIADAAHEEGKATIVRFGRKARMKVTEPKEATERKLKLVK